LAEYLFKLQNIVLQPQANSRPGNKVV